MTVITRFAPSPTGFLHIGGARTALFNYLFAKHHGGKYLLRIEDTDRERSTDQAVQAIFEGLAWLGLTHDGDAIMQFSRKERHKEVALQMVENGMAYYCYSSPETLQAFREQAEANKTSLRYISPWRDPSPDMQPPAGVKPVVRLKAPLTGETVIDDAIQGTIRVANAELDDLILLRSDGTPTYMHAVVVDDHDMGITHVIRGDDHLTNAFRQKLIYQAMGWEVPIFGHIPLIHGPDGTKLSKRHGAMPVGEYQAMGFLPEAVCNYLLRLGWSHGDDEIISREQATEWFDLDHVGKSPSRFDMQKLLHTNAHYLREASSERLLTLLPSFTEPYGNEEENWLKAGMDGLKQRAKTLVELAENARFYTHFDALNFTDAANELKATLKESVFLDLKEKLSSQSAWDKESLQTLLKQIAETHALKLGDIAAYMRLALTKNTISPSVFEIMEVLGKEETLRRLSFFLS